MVNRIFKKKSQYALKLERILGFYPKNINVYKQAFTHKSTLSDNDKKIAESNERLEFLGDTVLSTVVSHFLFVKFPFKDEGFLTQLRSRFVSREMLNLLGRKIGLSELIEKKPEEHAASIYGNTLEALIGAIYIDKGYKVAQNFIYQKLIHNHIDTQEVMVNETNFKSRVIEWCQKDKHTFRFEVKENQEKNIHLYTVELFLDDKLEGVGIANSKKKAEQLASEQFYNEHLKEIIE
ncbi:MAG: ribonuclease III [Flavobacteriales bacterium CG18_big_fil_WC_8_21_14_2_50_32_9]|nr:MAG: ribonuclease III [Flavobacteriales bacterium CG18_big_fil_WC_8_21_14_2_50_32_9]